METKNIFDNNSKVIITNTIVKDYDVETGNKLINNYMILKEIGRGVHGKVKLAQNTINGELVAIKIVDKKNRRRQMGYSLLRGSQHIENISEENEQKIKREISILKKCYHPNIVQLLEVIDVPETRKIYMVLEYTEKGEIEWRDELDQPILSIQEAKRIFRDIVNGLDYLHYLGIIHRDIKPANILLSHDGVAKISDFGVSYYNELLSTQAQFDLTEEALKKIDRELAETAGTPAFFAPELCCAGDTMQIKSPRISKAIDIWALGVTLYCIVFGQCPFIAATEFELFDAIPTQPLTFPSFEHVGFEIDDDLKDLFHKLLTKNPDDRITLDQVKRHPWVTEGLKDIEEWLSKTDPQHYISIQETLPENLSMLNRIRQSIRKLSFSFGSRRKSRPVSLSSQRLSQTPVSSQPTLNQSLRPISSDLSSDEEQVKTRPDITRRVSTASSNSGLTFGKFRGGMTPMEPKQ